MQLSVHPEYDLISVDEASEGELDQLETTLTKKMENAKFHPAVKRKQWDGRISFIKNHKWIPTGLWHEINKMCKHHGFNLDIQNLSALFDNNIDFEQFKTWALNYFEGNDDITPQDYQIQTAYDILRFRRCLAEMATSSGKTLMAYLVLAWIIEQNPEEKILFIVPNTSLVVQASEDFFQYNWRNQTKIKVQQIYANQKVYSGRNIVIGTYQSLIKKDKDYFSQFGTVVVDECHKAKSDSIKKILKKCTKATYRFGMSGTLPKPDTLDRYTIMAHTGPSVANVDAKYLQNRGEIANCEVKVIEMNYVKDSVRHAFYDMAHDPNQSQEVFGWEKNYVIQSNGRLKFIRDIVDKLTGNSLVLFSRREYGINLYEEIRKISNRHVYYIDGQTDQSVRQTYMTKMEQNNNVILIASYGVFSQGISIRKIHNIFFTESFKSEIVIRQSIGRGLRKHASKDKVKIIDFVDDFSHGDWQNHLKRHGLIRRGIYKEQGFKYSVKQVSFEGDL